MQSIVLQADKLNKYFPGPPKFQVLHDVSLSVAKGEFATIMGKSGCGKSTLLYLLSTLDTDYTGSIFINEKLVTSVGEKSLAGFRNEHIGFVFQFHFLLPEFTALENVMLPALKLKKYSFEEIQTNALEKLRKMDLMNCAHKMSGKLSGGEQQRVAIARALINNPGIIMADEPTGNLDSSNSAIIFNLFRDICKEGNTIIAVTHDVDFAKKSHRIIEMVDGRIQG